MGLDMYLKADKYVGNWNHSDKEEKGAYAKLVSAIGLEGFSCDENPSVFVTVTVGYWRKANAIHNWFVTNLQDGKDECQESYASREKMMELLQLCDKVLATKDASLLPPRSGFFLGSTDIDEGYWQDIEHTKKTLTAVLNDPRFNGFSFTYRASW